MCIEQIYFCVFSDHLRQPTRTEAAPFTGESETSASSTISVLDPPQRKLAYSFGFFCSMGGPGPRPQKLQAKLRQTERDREQGSHHSGAAGSARAARGSRGRRVLAVAPFLRFATKLLTFAAAYSSRRAPHVIEGRVRCDSVSVSPATSRPGNVPACCRLSRTKPDGQTVGR